MSPGNSTCKSFTRMTRWLPEHFGIRWLSLQKKPQGPGGQKADVQQGLFIRQRIEKSLAQVARHLATPGAPGGKPVARISPQVARKTTRQAPAMRCKGRHKSMKLKDLCGIL